MTDDKKRRSLRITKHAPDVSRDVNDEVEFHLEMRTKELIDQGVAPDAARKAAQEAFGDRRAIKARLRGITAPEIKKEHRAELVGSFFRDTRFAVRGLLREPGFALVAILTLALCIGANAAVFSVVNGVVLRPLPFPDADRLVTFFNAYPASGVDRGQNSAPDFFDRRGLDAIDDVALYNEISVTIGEESASRNVFSMNVSPPFFDVLGVTPALGRTFTEDEGEAGNHRKVIISHGWWQQYFGGDPDIIGQQTEASGALFTIVGVMPEGFHFTTWDAEMWFPLPLTDDARDAYHQNNYDMIGRLLPGAAVEQAQSQVDALNASIIAFWPAESQAALADSGFKSVVVSYQGDLVRDVRAPLYVLWGSVVFVLLIGCLNISNLLLVRSSARLQELSTRFVLGASRWRIARQLLTESLVLNAIGGGVGLLVGGWSLRFLGTFEYYQVPRLAEVAVDAQTIGFTLALAVLVAWVASVVPVLAIGRRDMYAVFRSGSATPSERRGAGRAVSPSNTLVAAQIGIAFVLLSGGSLMLASLMNLWAVDPGFDSEDLLAGVIALSGERYAEADARVAFATRAAQELASIPGVTSAALATQLPFSGQEESNVLTPEGYTRREGEARATHYSTIVTPGYFETMGIPLVAGRDFDITDTHEAAGAVIVDRQVAELYWPGDDALGRRLVFNIAVGDDPEWFTVVGIVGTIIQNDLENERAIGAVYLPNTQVATSFWRTVVRSESDTATTAAAVRNKILELDNQMPVFWTQTIEAAVAERLIPRRVPMMIVMVFAAAALVLATIGVYGVFAYTVARRTKEIGIRVALGSSVSDIYKLMLRHAMIIIGAGIVVGVAGSQALNRMIANQLYEVGPANPVVLGLAALTIGTVALIACLAPTRRATRVDAMVALREG